MSDAYPVLRVGQRLKSQVCSTELIVTRPGSGTVHLACGGQPMVDIGGASDPQRLSEASPGGGTQIGARYTSPDDAGFEVLVTKAGYGSLTDGDCSLVRRASKQLPSSD